MQTSLRALLLLSLLAVGCNNVTPTGNDAAIVRDANPGSDSGNDAAPPILDAAADAPTSDDAAIDASEDASTTPDASTDGGPAVADSGVCVEPHLGDACDDTAGGARCATGFECSLGRCVPQDRETCGGFAGAPCDEDPSRTVCVYETGHGDVGTCFSESEHRCLCAIDSARWCPS